jgi:LuxR family maltose regulon positive regulatory protein
MLAGTMIWTGEFGEGERWLERTRQALQTDTGPDITLLLHQTAGILHAGLGRHREAFEELSAAECLGSQLADSRALATRTTRWLLATQARLGMTSAARASLTALDDDTARSGEIRNALAVIRLAEGDPAAALAAVASVLDGTAPAHGTVTVLEAHLLAGSAASTPSSRFVTAPRRCGARGSCGCWPLAVRVRPAVAGSWLAHWPRGAVSRFGSTPVK